MASQVPSYTTKELSKKTWPDFERLFSQKNGWDFCWCMHFHRPRGLPKNNPEKHLWAESYQRDLRDVLVLQEDIAHDIAREIRIKLTPQDKARLSSVRPVNPEAQQAYLRGIYHWNKRSPEALKAAIAHFKERSGSIP